jgi:hypothetical protein
MKNHSSLRHDGQDLADGEPLLVWLLDRRHPLSPEESRVIEGGGNFHQLKTDCSARPFLRNSKGVRSCSGISVGDQNHTALINSQLAIDGRRKLLAFDIIIRTVQNDFLWILSSRRSPIREKEAATSHHRI